MKHTMQYSVGGQLVDVAPDRKDEFFADVANNGQTADEIVNYRVAKADGSTQDVPVSTRNIEAFTADVERNGDTAYRMRNFVMDDGARLSLRDNDVQQMVAIRKQGLPISRSVLKNTGIPDIYGKSRAEREAIADQLVAMFPDEQANPQSGKGENFGDLISKGAQKIVDVGKEIGELDAKATDALLHNPVIDNILMRQGTTVGDWLEKEGIAQNAVRGANDYSNAIVGKIVSQLPNAETIIAEAVKLVSPEEGAKITAHAQAWRDAISEALPTDTANMETGAGDTANAILGKINDFSKNTLATIGTFAIPGAAPVEIAANSANSYYTAYAEAKKNGKSDAEAEALATAKAGVGAVEGIILAGAAKGANGVNAFLDGLKKAFVTGGKMAATAGAGDIVQQGIEGAENPDLVRAGKVALEAGAEGVAFDAFSSAVHGAQKKLFHSEPSNKGSLNDKIAREEKTKRAEEARKRYETTLSDEALDDIDTTIAKQVESGTIPSWSHTEEVKANAIKKLGGREKGESHEAVEQAVMEAAQEVQERLDKTERVDSAALERRQAEYEMRLNEARAKREAEKKRGVAKEKLTPLPEKPSEVEAVKPVENAPTSVPQEKGTTSQEKAEKSVEGQNGANGETDADILRKNGYLPPSEKPITKGGEVVISHPNGVKYRGEVVSVGTKNIKIKSNHSIYGEQVLTFPRSQVIGVKDAATAKVPDGKGKMVEKPTEAAEDAKPTKTPSPSITPEQVRERAMKDPTMLRLNDALAKAKSETERNAILAKAQERAAELRKEMEKEAASGKAEKAPDGKGKMVEAEKPKTEGAPEKDGEPDYHVEQRGDKYVVVSKSGNAQKVPDRGEPTPSDTPMMFKSEKDAIAVADTFNKQKANLRKSLAGTKDMNAEEQMANLKAEEKAAKASWKAERETAIGELDLVIKSKVGAVRKSLSKEIGEEVDKLLGKKSLTDDDVRKLTNYLKNAPSSKEPVKIKLGETGSLSVNDDIGSLLAARGKLQSLGKAASKRYYEINHNADIADRLDLHRLDPKLRSDSKILAWAKKKGRAIDGGKVSPDAVREYEAEQAQKAAKAVKRWFPDMKVVYHDYGENIERGQKVIDQSVGRLYVIENNKPAFSAATESGSPSARLVSAGATSHTLTRESAEPVAKFADSISKNGAMRPADFLVQLQKSLGSSNDNPNESQYFSIENDGKLLSLRLANHRGNAAQFIINGNNADGKIGIVVKMNSKRFAPHSDVEYVEFVYHPDKMTAAVQSDIAKAVSEWIKTGEYEGPRPSQLNKSPKRKIDYAGVEDSVAYGVESTIFDTEIAGVVDKLIKIAEKNIRAGHDDTPSQAEERSLKKKIAELTKRKRNLEEDLAKTHDGEAFNGLLKERLSSVRDHIKDVKSELNQLRAQGVGEDTDLVDWYTNKDFIDLIESIRDGSIKESTWWDKRNIGDGGVGPLAETLAGIRESGIFIGKDLEHFKTLEDSLNKVYDDAVNDLIDPKGPFGESLVYLRDTSGRSLGWFDPKSKEVHLLPGSNAETVAHEIMWHGVRDWATTEAGKGNERAKALLAKMKEVEQNVPEKLKNEVTRLYRMTGVTSADVLFNEWGAWFTMGKGGKEIEKVLDSAEGRKWFARSMNAVKEIYKDFLTAHGKNRVDLKEIDGMGRDEFVDWLAKNFAGGKTLGNIKGEGTGKELSTEETKFQAARRKVYDVNSALTDLQADIEKKTGKKIGEDMDAAGENALTPGLREAENIRLKKSIKEYKEIISSSDGKVSDQDIQYYMELKAAAGRDAKVDARNKQKLAAEAAERVRREWGDERIAKDREGFKAAVEEAVDAVKAEYESTNGSHVDPREAKKMLAELENGEHKEIYAKARQKLREMMDETLRVQEEAGLVSHEEAERLRKEEPEYVPFKNEYDLETGEWIGRGLNNFNKPEFYQAKGRQSSAGDITTHIFMDNQAAHQRAIENGVREKLAKLVEANPELGKVRKLNRNAEFGDNAAKLKEADNIVLFKRNGESYVIELNGTRGKAIANAITEKGVWRPKNAAWNAFAKFSRTQAGLATRYSLTFPGRNVTKDNIELANIVFSERGLVNGTKWMAHYAKSTTQMAKPIFKYVTTGKIDTNTAEGRLLQRFIDAGGVISGGATEGYDAIKKLLTPEAIEKEMKRGKSKTHTIAKHTLKSIAYMNEFFELTTRVNAFAAETAMGATDKQAALFARRVTVDFNRHGEWTGVTNVVRMFSNSTLGATARAATALGKSKYGKAIAGACFVSGLAQSLIEYYMNREEDEEAAKTGRASGRDVSEYERKTSLFHVRHGDKFYKVAQHESPFSLFSYAGDLCGRLVTGQITAKDAAKNLGVSVAELGYAFTGLGDINLQSQDGGLANDAKAAIVSGIVPSVVQPAAEIVLNMDYKGSKVARKNYSEYVPDSSVAKSHTPEWAKSTAEYLNKATRGEDSLKGYIDVPPEAVQKLVEGYGKNAFKDVMEVYETGKAIITGKLPELDVRNIPVVRDVVRPLDGNTARFYEAMDRYENNKLKFDHNDEPWKEGERGAYLKSHPWLRKNSEGKRFIDTLNNKTEKEHPRVPTVDMGIKQLRKLTEGKIRRKDGSYFEPNTPISEEVKEKARQRLLKLQARVVEIMGE